MSQRSIRFWVKSDEKSGLTHQIWHYLDVRSNNQANTGGFRLTDTLLSAFPIIGADFRLPKIKIWELYFIYFCTFKKFNKYIFISPVMQIKFQAAGAVQLLTLRCWPALHVILH